jgi:hypothetical protein
MHSIFPKSLIIFQENRHDEKNNGQLLGQFFFISRITSLLEELVSSASCPDVDGARDSLSLFTLLNKE